MRTTDCLDCNGYVPAIIAYSENLAVTNTVVSEHTVKMNKFQSQIGHSSLQINPAITNPDYNEQKWPVPSCSLLPSLTVCQFQIKENESLLTAYRVLS